MKIEKMKYDSKRAKALLYRNFRLFPFNPAYNDRFIPFGTIDIWIYTPNLYADSIICLKSLGSLILIIS